MGKTYTIQIHNLIGGRAISGQKALIVLFGLLFSFQISFGSNVTEHEAFTSSFSDTIKYKLLSSEIFEAEDSMDTPGFIVRDTDNDISRIFTDAASNDQGVSIFDPNDKVKIPFTIPSEGNYVFFVRVRSNSEGENIDYTITIDDSTAINFSEIDESLSPESPDLNGSHWITLEVDDSVALTGTDHTLEIEANGFFQAIDFIEVGKVDVAGSGSYSGSLPAPANPVLDTLNSTKLSLAWDAVPGVTGYRIEEANDINGPFTELETVGRYSIYYHATGLSESESKAFRIIALRGISESTASDTVSGTTTVIPANYANMNHVATIGDDLALGTTSTDPTRISIYNNYKFNNGVTAETGTDFSLLPIGGDGGTSATAAHFWKNILNKSGSKLEYEGYEIFISISGESGKKLSELSKGNTAYTKMLSQFSNADTLSRNESLSYAKRAVYLFQGSADAATDTAAYKTSLLGFRDDLDADVGANIPLVIAQVNEGTVGIAQFNAAKNDDNIFIASPTYFVPDSVDGRQWLGQYFSKVYQSEVFIDTLNKPVWTGLSPKEISRTENTVLIEFNVPTAPLVFDTDIVTEQTAKGFEISDANGVVGIKSVKIVDGNKVVITVNDGETLGNNAKVSYALSTGKGNLKDSETKYNTSSYKDSEGDFYKLNNWAFAFDEDIPNGTPEAPTSLVAMAVSNTQIDLSWDDMGTFASEYVIESSASDSPYNFSEIGTVSSNSFSDTLLTADTEYFYRIKAQNSTEESTYSDTVSTSTFPPIPAIPTGLMATAISNTEVEIAWTKLADNVTGYTLEFSEGDDENFQTVTDMLSPNTENYIHSELTGNTTYYYRLFAKNGESTSDYSDTVNTVTDVPDGPSGLTVTANSTSELSISWNTMSGNVNNYFLESSMSKTGPFTALATIEASDTSFLHMNLSADTTVYYRVKAEIDAVQTGYASAVEGTTNPSAPTNLTATGTSISEIKVSWVSPGGSVTSFVLESADSENGTYSELATIDTANTSYVHDGLSANTTVWYQIKAINAGGASEYSAKDSATTLSPALDIPAGLVATPISSSQIDIKWNSVDGATSYILQVSNTDVAADFVNLETIDAPETTYAHTGLDPETTKFYRVKATNASGQSDYSASANTTTIADLPAIPGNFKANAISDSDIKLTWDKLTENVDGYIIESGDAEAGPFTQLIALSDTASTYTHSGLAANTQKFYRIKATNGDATSDYSAVVNATTTITGIEDELHFDVFRVFPNPSNGVFQIELNTNRLESGKMTVFNAIGKVVFEKQINSQSAESIDLSSLKKGLYIINVKTSSNHQMKKIILE
ncbi:MAG: fibronectin type III domain-containing protein [Flammeovirgaceae bacterium]|nr:fibronectin type III domain-containing protein [Flammeovirgaceae bacterium]